MEAVSLLIVLATLGVDVGWITGADGRPVYSFRVEPELLTELRNGQAIVSAVDPVDQQNLRQFQIVVGKTDLTPVRTGSLNANGYYERSDMVQYGWKPSSTGPGVDYFVQISPERMESLSKGTPISDLVDPVTSIQRFYIFMGMETLPRELPAVSTTTAQPATATATTPPAGTNAAFGSPSGGGTLRGVGSPTLGNATPIGFGNMQTGTNPSTATTPTYPGRLAPSNTTSGGLNNGGNIYSTNTGGNTSGNPSGAVGGNLGGNWQSVCGQNTNPDHFGTGGGNFSTGNQQLSSAGTLPVPPLNDPNANYGFGSTSPANVYRPADPSLQANAGLGNLAGYSAGWQQNCPTGGCPTGGRSAAGCSVPASGRLASVAAGRNTSRRYFVHPSCELKHGNQWRPGRGSSGRQSCSDFDAPDSDHADPVRLLGRQRLSRLARLELLLAVP
jgi:hypothetical protein